MHTNDEHKQFVRIRGLPFESKDSDVHAFFRPLNIVYVRAIITDDKSDKSPTQAYVRFESSDAASQALSRNKSKIGRRFIEIFPVNDPNELQQLSSHSLDSVIYKIGLDRFHNYEKQRRPDDGFVVKLRGLPFESTATSVMHFLLPLRVNESDLFFPNGEKKDICFVKLRNATDVKQAMQKHKQHLDSRYIEVFPSSLHELESSRRDQGKNDNGRSARDRSPLRGVKSTRDARDRSPLRGMSDGSRRENNHSHDDRRGYRERDSRDSHSNTSDDRVRHRADRQSVDRSKHRDDNQFVSSRPSGDGGERRQREKFLAYKPRSQGITEVSQTNVPLGSPFVVKLRGVSYHHTVDDVMQFLIPVVPDALYIMIDFKGRASGDVYLELADSSDVDMLVSHSHIFRFWFRCMHFGSLCCLIVMVDLTVSKRATNPQCHTRNVFLSVFDALLTNCTLELMRNPAVNLLKVVPTVPTCLPRLAFIVPIINYNLQLYQPFIRYQLHQLRSRAHFQHWLSVFAGCRLHQLLERVT